MLVPRVLSEISDLNSRDCNGFKLKTEHEDGGKQVFSPFKYLPVQHFLLCCS